MDPHQTTTSVSSMSESTHPPRSPSVTATYIYNNSKPSTPLPATISKYTAYGLNWGIGAAPLPLSTGESEVSGSEFPWDTTTSTSAALGSPPIIESGAAAAGSSAAVEYMQRALSSPPESPFLQDARPPKVHGGRRLGHMKNPSGGSSSSKNNNNNNNNNNSGSKPPAVTAAPRVTNFFLNLPPVNQLDLLQQAGQHPRHQTTADTAERPSSERVTLTSGLPSTILEGQILSTGLTSIPRNYLVRRRSHNDSLQRGGGGGAVGGLMSVEGSSTLSSATVVQSGTHLQVISGGLPLALLTPPDEERVITWNPSDASIPSKGQRSTTVRRIMERPNTDGTQPQQALDAANYTQAPSSSDRTAPSYEASASVLEVHGDSGSSAEPSNTEPDQPAFNDNRPSLFLSGFGQDLWLREALRILLIPPGLPVRTTTEAVRLMAYTLPCPLPPPTTSAAESPAEAAQAANLPSSAVAAPAVAAAAGFTLSAAMASMCQNSDNGPLETPGGTAIFRPYDGTSTALHSLTSAIQRMYEDASKRVYIHVSHAISPNTPLTQIPSPSLSGGNTGNPATPHSAGFFSPYVSSGQLSGANGGDGYFSNIFNSIVVAHEPVPPHPTPNVSQPSTTPGYFIRHPMPNPILPPLSLHYSLLERYIPPPTSSTDSAIFSPKSSLLLDRVFELSPNGGSLLFIYPTKTGAKQFCERYLGKVLDPLLRRLMVLYRLRDDLLWNISRMSAVEHMQEYEGLKARVNEFCSVLSGDTVYATRNSEAQQGPGKTTGHPSPTNFLVPVSVVHAEKVMVQLNDVSWRKWWTQQEHARIRDVIKGHFSAAPSQAPSSSQSANSLSSNLKSTLPKPSAKSKGGTLATAPQYNGPADLAREILDGVKVTATRPSSRGMGEAVFASAMVGNAGSWGVVGDGSSRTHPHHGTGFQPPTRKEHDSEGIEVGVFVIRRIG